jgi:hypothetical protein
MLAMAIFPLWAPAQVGKVLERQVKAAYLYKFAGFVEWPESCFARPDSPLIIAVAGADPLAEQLEIAIVGRNANGRPLQVRRLRVGDSLSGTHMLFLGAALDKTSALDLIAATRGQPVLTVTDADESSGLGAMISFVMVDERLRFEVILKHAMAAHLRISARMLQAALRVQQVTS